MLFFAIENSTVVLKQHILLRLKELDTYCDNIFIDIKLSYIYINKQSICWPHKLISINDGGKLLYKSLREKYSVTIVLLYNTTSQWWTQRKSLTFPITVDYSFKTINRIYCSIYCSRLPISSKMCYHSVWDQVKTGFRNTYIAVTPAMACSFSKDVVS